MYGAVGTSTEVTALATQFLPAQVASALIHGYNPQVYASEALGLAFAFSNENGSTAFANNFGPSHAGTPNTVAGDAAFATAASIAIFGAASTPTLVTAIQNYVANWKAFYEANGMSGILAPHCRSNRPRGAGSSVGRRGGAGASEQSRSFSQSGDKFSHRRCAGQGDLFCFPCEPTGSRNPTKHAADRSLRRPCGSYGRRSISRSFRPYVRRGSARTRVGGARGPHFARRSRGTSTV